MTLRGPKLHPTVARQWLDDQSLKTNTKRDYELTLALLQRRCQRRHGRIDVRFNEISPDDVRDFVTLTEAGVARADRSRRKYLGTVWQVFDWAAAPEVGLVVTNPAARLKVMVRRERRAPRDARRKTWLSEDQARALLAAGRSDPGPLAERDTFIVSLFLYTGLRLAELQSLRWRDVDFGAGRNGVLHVIRKGGSLAQVPLTKAAYKALFAWRSRFIEGYGSDAIADLHIVPAIHSRVIGYPTFQKDPPRELIILWARGIGQSTIRTVVRRRAAAIGMSMAPHDLRRSFAGMLRDRGAELDEIRDALGHVYLATTEIYLSKRPELSSAAEALDLG